MKYSEPRSTATRSLVACVIFERAEPASSSATIWIVTSQRYNTNLKATFLPFPCATPKLVAPYKHEQVKRDNYPLLAASTTAVTEHT